jgi:hypothetical protein
VEPGDERADDWLAEQGELDWLSDPRRGEPAGRGKSANIAGRIAKYFATSFAIESVVSAPRVIRSCLPTSTISISFVGFESRSTMLPASFAAEAPVFIATPTSAWASAGASLVPSPVVATIPCSSRMHDEDGGC